MEPEHMAAYLGGKRFYAPALYAARIIPQATRRCWPQRLLLSPITSLMACTDTFVFELATFSHADGQLVKSIVARALVLQGVSSPAPALVSVRPIVVSAPRVG
jgi:hypothetical protein